MQKYRLLADQPITIDFKTVDGMAIKQILIPPEGATCPQHAHVLDHSTLLAVGSVILRRVDQCNAEERYDAPAIIFIPAGQVHEFVTLTPNTLLYCLHNLHHGDAPQILREHQLDFADL